MLRGVYVSPDALKLILSGRKTQIRQPAPGGCPYHAGHSYALQSGAVRHSERITVTQPPRLEKLGDASLRDIKREGYRTIAEWRSAWEALHGSYDPHAQVWVISFVRGDHSEAADTPRLLRASAPQAPVCKARVKTADGKTRACNRAFPDGATVCKCGAARPRATAEDSGYTTSTYRAMRDEGEAVPPSVQASYSRQAYERDSKRRAQQRREVLTQIEQIIPYASGRERKRLRAAASQIRAIDKSSPTLAMLPPRSADAPGAANAGEPQGPLAVPCAGEVA